MCKATTQPRSFPAVVAAACLMILLMGLMAVASCKAHADTVINAASDAAAPSTCSEKRPVVMFNRWQEDWSVLSSSCVPHEPLDGLKYIPLGGDPDSYLSLGANLRERLEFNDAPLFGLGSGRSDTYVIQRAEISADARIGRRLQFFVQFEDARAFGKDAVSPVDKDPLDLEQ